MTVIRGFIAAKEDEYKVIEQICLDTWEPLYRFIYYKVQNHAETEDIMQETYVKALTYFQKHKIPRINCIGFMKTVALNEMRDRWRQNRRRGIPVNFEEINPEEMAAADQQNAVAQRLQLENALSKLSEEQRAILDLRIIKGYSVAETAKLGDRNPRRPGRKGLSQAASPAGRDRHLDGCRL